jgi:hypothetical protein
MPFALRFITFPSLLSFPLSEAMAQHELRVAQSEQRAAAETARLEAMVHASIASASASASAAVAAAASAPAAPAPAAASSMNDEEKAALLARLSSFEAKQTAQQETIAKRAHCYLIHFDFLFFFQAHTLSLFRSRSSVLASLALCLSQSRPN